MVYETAVSLGVVISAFILVYIGTKIKGKWYGHFQMFFMMIGMFIIWGLYGILAIILDNEGQTEIYNMVTTLQFVLTWVIVIVIFVYLFAMVIDSILQAVEKKRKKEKWSDDDEDDEL